MKGLDMDIDNIIYRLLLIDGNETWELSDVGFDLFHRLIVQLSAIKYNVRWCSNQNCVCWPESTIRRIIENKEINDLLRNFGLLENIKAIAAETSEGKITVWDNDKIGTFLLPGYIR
jgi:hypothetical protein